MRHRSEDAFEGTQARRLLPPRKGVAAGADRNRAGGNRADRSSGPPVRSGALSRLRRCGGALAVLVLLGAAPAAADPAAAQDEDGSSDLKVIVLANDMVDTARRQWQIRVTVRPLGSCVPTRGEVAYLSPWLDAGGEAAVELSLSECDFSIAAVMREHARPDCRYTAQLAWGAPGSDPDLEYVTGSILTVTKPRNEPRLSITRSLRSACGGLNRAYFVIRSTEVADELPAPSADPALEALARRAVAVTDFEVRVEPHYPPGTAVPPGCNRTIQFTLRGDGSQLGKILEDTGEVCRFRARVTRAPPPFELVETGGTSFDNRYDGIVVDLSSSVRLPAARIAIVQQVRGSADGGAVSYDIDRSCGDLTVAAPQPARSSLAIIEGTFTVHAPDFANFGAGAVYPAVAAGADSTEIVGCSVTVSLRELPRICNLRGPDARTLTWTSDNPLRGFDFHLTIVCHGTPPPAPEPEPEPAPKPEPEPEPAPEPEREPAPEPEPEPAPEPEPEPAPEPEPEPAPEPEPEPADDVVPAPEPAPSRDAVVRIVARRVAGDRVEFGLQQRDADGLWGKRLLPSARYFPPGVPLGRWLHSSPIDQAPGDVRIVARRVARDRVEFGLQRRGADGSWGERLLPSARNFPPGAPLDRWLQSSSLTLTAQPGPTEAHPLDGRNP